MLFLSPTFPFYLHYFCSCSFRQVYLILILISQNSAVSNPNAFSVEQTSTLYQQWFSHRLHYRAAWMHASPGQLFRRLMRIESPAHQSSSLSTETTHGILWRTSGGMNDTWKPWSAKWIASGLKNTYMSKWSISSVIHYSCSLILGIYVSPIGLGTLSCSEIIKLMNWWRLRMEQEAE